MLICWCLELGERGLFLSLFVLFTFASVYLRAEFIYVVGCESGRRWEGREKSWWKGIGRLDCRAV